MEHHDRSRARRGRRSHIERSRRSQLDSSDDLVETLFAPIGAKRTDPRVERKTRQLCRVVLETVSLALGELGDPRLEDVVVLDVEPAPDSSRLAVRLSVPAGALADAELALDGVRARLRALVAADVHRKRAPELALMLLPAGAP